MDAGSVEQQAMLRRFVAACEQDERVLAAFLGGSFARQAADKFSDLDLYIITADSDYASFFADRQTFMQHLGQPVFLEDFNQFGFDMVIFTYADDVEGELALAPEGHFEHIHGGTLKILVDKQGLLADKVFPLLAPTQAEQIQTLRHLIYWFWEDLSSFIKCMNREQWWLAYSSLDQMRCKCVNLAHLQYDFTVEPVGYAKVEQDMPQEVRLSLETTFCSLQEAAMLKAAFVIVGTYKNIALLLAERYDIPYPVGIEQVLDGRLEQLHSRPGQADA